MNYRERIKNIREDKDMTQAQIAKILNCSQRAYSNYERGKVTMSPSLLVELAKFHGTSVDYLLDLTDEKHPYPEKAKKKYV